MSGYKIGLSFSPDGTYLATGSSGGALYFYDYTSARVMGVIKAFKKSPCTVVEYHPLLTSTVAIGSWNGKIAILK